MKATITELKYDSVKSKLIKIFSENSEVPTRELNDINIKTQPPIQKITLSTKLIMKMKTLNSNTTAFTKMTTTDRMNTILFTHLTIDIQSKKKGNYPHNDHSNVETTSDLTTINKITNNKTINDQTINDHNHQQQTLTGEIPSKLYKERTFQKLDVTHLTKMEFK